MLLWVVCVFLCASGVSFSVDAVTALVTDGPAATVDLGVRGVTSAWIVLGLSATVVLMTSLGPVLMVTGGPRARRSTTDAQS